MVQFLVGSKSGGSKYGSGEGSNGGDWVGCWLTGGCMLANTQLVGRAGREVGREVTDTSANNPEVTVEEGRRLFAGGEETGGDDLKREG